MTQGGGDEKAGRQLKLPSSVYSALFLTVYASENNPCAGECSANGAVFCVFFNLFQGSLPLFIMYVLTMAVHSGVIVYLNQITHDTPAVCDDTPYFLRLIAVFVFSVLTLADLDETWATFLYLQHIPIVPEWTDLNQFVKNPFTGEVTGFQVGHGITTLQKWVAIVISVVPRAVLGIYLW
jgi:hypothetical protein